jgi:hypothetical protein
VRAFEQVVQVHDIPPFFNEDGEWKIEDGELRRAIPYSPSSIFVSRNGLQALK